MFGPKTKTVEEQLIEACRSRQSSEWYQVEILAADGSKMMEVSVLWTADYAAAFKQLSEGVSITVSRKVETLEPI